MSHISDYSYTAKHFSDVLFVVGGVQKIKNGPLNTRVVVFASKTHFNIILKKTFKKFLCREREI